MRSTGTSRRCFLHVLGSSMLVVGGAACGGGDGAEQGGGADADVGSDAAPSEVSVGAPELFAEIGLHKVPNTDVLVGRDEAGLYARSAICTHRSCNMNERGRILPDGGIHCNCHSSEFSATGGVLQGPAIRALPSIAIELTDDGNLIVYPGTPVDEAFRLSA